MNRKNLLALLNEEIRLTKDARDVLVYSLEQCRAIGTRDSYTNGELTEYEALTARFSRLSDILIQKLLRTLDTLELEEPGTIRDRINRAEKRNLVQTAEDLIKIRTLRNEIVHEYLPEALQGLFREVLLLTPILIEITGKTVDYAESAMRDYP